MYEYRALVQRVLDADTVDVIVDLGFNITRLERVRLAGVDAPELREAAGSAAASYVRDLLPWRRPVIVRTEKPYPHDKYGRYLATIVLGDGRVLNDLLIAEGFAVAYDGGAR